MKTIKVSEATNEQLDYLVAQCEGKKLGWRDRILDASELDLINGVAHSMIQRYSPSTNWSQMGPIIEREGVHLFQPVDSHFKPLSQWVAALPYNSTSTLKRCSYGPTPLIAAARCYVVSKLGDTVEVPEELI